MSVFLPSICQNTCEHKISLYLNIVPRSACIPICVKGIAARFIHPIVGGFMAKEEKVVLEGIDCRYFTRWTISG